MIIALDEVHKKVGEGYTSGHDSNESGSYEFTVTTVGVEERQRDERVYLLSYYLKNNIIPISEELGRHEPDPDNLASLVAEYLEKEFNTTDQALIKGVMKTWSV